MCGICGFLCLDGENTAAEATLRRMTTVQKHRGPDDEGYFCAQGVSLGFCRLAILDLIPAGNQPMSNEDGTIWLVFIGSANLFRFTDGAPAGDGGALR